MKPGMTDEDHATTEAPRTEGGDGLLGLPAQLVAALRNAMDIARMGRLEQTAKTPNEVVLRRPNFKLKRYLDVARGHDGDAGPAIVMVPPLMITAEVYDIAPGGSAVETLLGLGVDPWVVDF